MRSVTRLVPGLVVAVVLAACDTGSPPPSANAHPPTTTAAPSPSSVGVPTSATPTSDTPPATRPPAVVASVCPPSADWGPTSYLPERQGVGHDATLWALFFPEEPTLKAGQDLKVVWRMTGAGNFSISATGPAGAVVRPVWGPDWHPSSTWDRPGEEWGTGWVFPTAGCWTVTAKREAATGYIVLRVAAAKP